MHVQVQASLRWNREWLIKSHLIYWIVNSYLDNCGNSGANTCEKPRTYVRGAFIRSKPGPHSAFREPAEVPKVGCGGTLVNRASFPSVLVFSGCCAENRSHGHWRQPKQDRHPYRNFWEGPTEEQSNSIRRHTQLSLTQLNWVSLTLVKQQHDFPSALSSGHPRAKKTLHTS